MNIYTLENIDRSIYNAIRLALVAVGYLADISTYAANPDKEAGLLAYQTANGLISPLIEIFGEGTGASRMEKNVNRIVIERRSITAGDIGGGTAIYKPVLVSNTLDSYEKTFYPDMTSTISYDIRTITSSTQVDRIILGILNKVLGRRKRVSYFTDFETDSGLTFGTVFNGSSLVATGQTNNIKETLYSYVVPNIFIDDEATDPISVPIMRSVEVTASFDPNSEDAVSGEAPYNDVEILT